MADAPIFQLFYLSDYFAIVPHKKPQQQQSAIQNCNENGQARDFISSVHILWLHLFALSMLPS